MHIGIIIHPLIIFTREINRLWSLDEKLQVWCMLSEDVGWEIITQITYMAISRNQQDRQCIMTYEKGASYNHCCRRKAVSITCSVCVFLALAIQHAMRIYMLGSTTFFFHII